MALKIYERYEPLANPGTAEYPTGSIKNKSAPQNKDGTPIEQDWANDLLGMRDAILAAGNVQADGNVENAVNSQIVEALKAFLVESERVVQTPGSSEDDVMSQKAVTDALPDIVTSKTDTSGGDKVITQGWMGLGATQGLPAPSDLNDAVENGFYYINGNTPNAPTSGDGAMIVVGEVANTPSSSHGDMMQIATMLGG